MEAMFPEIFLQQWLALRIKTIQKSKHYVRTHPPNITLSELCLNKLK